MLYFDFQMLQGVLAVETVSIIAAIADSPPACEMPLSVILLASGDLSLLDPQFLPNLDAVPEDMIWSASQNQVNQISPTGVVNPGDVDLPKPPKSHISALSVINLLGDGPLPPNQPILSNIETVPGDMIWSASQNQLNQISPSGVVNPGDVDYPKPPR